MKRSFVAVMLTMSLASVGQAQDFTTGQAVGTITGAVIGNHFGGGSGKVAMTVLGAIVGNEVGRNLSGPQGYQPPVSSYHNYDLSSGSTPVMQRNAQQYEIRRCMGDGYHNGEYNPPAAASYCRGVMEAQRQRQARVERDAYIEGIRAQQEMQRQAYRQGWVDSN